MCALPISVELTRTAVFFDSKANWWLSLIDEHTDVSPSLSDGLRAYAERQADFQHQHANQVQSQLNAAHDKVSELTHVVCPSNCFVIQY